MSNTAQSLASKRIASLLDENSFVEIGSCVTARNTDFNLSEKEHRQTVSSPVMVSSTAAWCMCTARTLPF